MEKTQVQAFIHRDYPSRVMADYVLKKGVGSIVFEAEEALVLKVGQGSMFAVYADNMQAAQQCLPYVREAKFITAETEEMGHSFLETLENYQKLLTFYTYHYPHKEFIKVGEKARLAPARPEHLHIILENYAHITEEKAREDLQNGDILGAYVEGELAGFIGFHEEGSIGMLVVLPAYRRMGLGFQLEGAAINRQLSQGLPPYCQVRVDNEPSQQLQKKLGMIRCETPCLWMVKHGDA
ncbi:MAG: GNAT family N-acetyltransferase [Christensenellales bacterium]|jgi:GNAT superfamily N-acetyltransferase